MLEDGHLELRAFSEGGRKRYVVEEFSGPAPRSAIVHFTISPVSSRVRFSSHCLSRSEERSDPLRRRDPADLLLGPRPRTPAAKRVGRHHRSVRALPETTERSVPGEARRKPARTLRCYCLNYAGWLLFRRGHRLRGTATSRFDEAADRTCRPHRPGYDDRLPVPPGRLARRTRTRRSPDRSGDRTLGRGGVRGEVALRRPRPCACSRTGWRRRRNGDAAWRPRSWEPLPVDCRTRRKAFT